MPTEIVMVRKLVFFLIFFFLLTKYGYSAVLWQNVFDDVSVVTDICNESGNTGVLDIDYFKNRIALKAFLDPDVHPVTNRTECTAKGLPFGAGTDGQNVEFFRTYTVEFELYFDESFVQDTARTICFQVHGQADDGEAAREPMFDLEIDSDGTDTTYTVNVRGDTVATSNPAALSYEEAFPLGSVEEDVGVWVKWKFQFYLDYTDGNGSAKVWKNDVLVVNTSGNEVGYNDNVGPYFKFGIYKPGWTTTDPGTGADDWTQYYDNITITVNNIGYRTGVTF